MRIVLGALALLAVATLARAEVIYVDIDATGTNDGTSWVDAYVDLQDALGRATDGDEIWVAEGEYRPGRGEDRTATFRLVDGVGLYGGFAGHEVTRDQRDWDANESALSGQVNEPDIPYVDPYDDVYHVVTAESVGPSTVIDGFTIKHGHSPYASHPSENGGGGILIRDSDVVVRHALITSCFSDGYGGGGGVWIGGDSKPEFADVEFRTNGVPEGFGGAVYGRGRVITFRDCVFVGNGARYGAFVCPSELYDCRFEENWTDFSAVIARPRVIVRTEFIDNHNSGGVFGSCLGGNVYMEDCLFERNSSSRSQDDVRNNHLSSDGLMGSGTLINVTFVDNGTSVVSRGGTTMINCSMTSSGVHLGAHRLEPPFDPVEDAFKMINCTVIDGWVVSNGERVEIANSIVWDPRPYGQELVALESINDAEFSVAHSLIQGSGGSGSAWNSEFGNDLGGNIDADPLFADPENGDLRLSFPSPAVNAGHTALLPDDVFYDLGGSPRIYGSSVDMGAYEFQAPGIRDLFAARFTPQTLNVESGGQYVQVDITPQWTYLTADVDRASLVLDGSIEPIRVKAGPHSIKLKFDRAQVLASLHPGPRVPVTVSGVLNDGTNFSAVDTIAVVDPSAKHPGEPELKPEGPVAQTLTIAPQRYLRAAPNPFNPSTTIYYGTPQAGHVDLTIYDLAGRRVKTLVTGHATAGDHEAAWDGRDEAGKRVASGVYLYQLRADEYVETKRMVLLK